jgi:uncharacterized membrane protein
MTSPGDPISQEARLEGSARATILIHYYRAMVGRADIWRMRLDTTTNWAIGATAAVVSFALGNDDAPHYVVHIASFLTVIFLLLEARRLTFYHLWQQRVLLLERALIAPAISSSLSEDSDVDPLERELAPQLGTTVPSMPLAKAAARRLRRVYVYLFTVQLLAWLLKLSSHPSQTTSIADFVTRAKVGVLPGAAILTVSVLAFVTAVALAIANGGVSRASDLPDDPA